MIHIVRIQKMSVLCLRPKAMCDRTKSLMFAFLVFFHFYEFVTQNVSFYLLQDDEGQTALHYGRNRTLLHVYPFFTLLIVS